MYGPTSAAMCSTIDRKITTEEWEKIAEETQRIYDVMSSGPEEDFSDIPQLTSEQLIELL